MPSELWTPWATPWPLHVLAGPVTRKSDVSDLRSRLIARKSGTPDFRCHLRLSAHSMRDVDRTRMSNAGINGLAAQLFNTLAVDLAARKQIEIVANIRIIRRPRLRLQQ